MVLSKRAKDIHRCLRNIDSFSNCQASVLDWDSDNLRWMKICVAPVDGPYKGGKFEFEVRFEKHYPKTSPGVSCLTPIYHPNIDPDCEEYNVCLSLLDEWQENFGLEDLIQGLLFLMYHPNLDDPLSPLFDGTVDDEEFLKNVKRSLRGKDVEGILFPRMIEDSEGADEEEPQVIGASSGRLRDTVESVVGDLVNNVLGKVYEEEKLELEAAGGTVEDEKKEETDGERAMKENESENKELEKTEDDAKDDAKVESGIADGVHMDKGESEQTKVGITPSESVAEATKSMTETDSDSPCDQDAPASVDCSVDKEDDCANTDICDKSNADDSELAKDNETGSAEDKTELNTSQSDEKEEELGACGGTLASAEALEITSGELKAMVRRLEELVRCAQEAKVECDTLKPELSDSDCDRDNSVDKDLCISTTCVQDSTNEEKPPADAAEAARLTLGKIQAVLDQVLPAVERTSRIMAEATRASHMAQAAFDASAAARDVIDKAIDEVNDIAKEDGNEVDKKEDDKVEDLEEYKPVTPKTPLAIPDILEKVEAILKDIEENGEPPDDIGDDSDDSYFTDESFDEDAETEIELEEDSFDDDSDFDEVTCEERRKQREKDAKMQLLYLMVTLPSALLVTFVDVGTMLAW